MTRQVFFTSQADGSLKFDTKLELSGFERGVAKMNQAAMAAGAAVVGVMSAATVAVIGFGSEVEVGMAKVSTLVTGTAEQCDAALTEISASLMETSSATGQAAVGLTEAAYQALSAGVAAADAGKFVDKAAKLAIGGFTSTESAVDVLSSVINAYGADLMDVDTASKILMQTQNKGKTTIDQLASSLAQCTPTAAAMGVSFEQVGASLATITAQGTPTSQATTQLNQLLAELGKNGTVAANNLIAAAEGTQHAGKSFSQLMQEGVPLSDLLLMLSGYAEQNGVALLDMFGSIESGKAALSIAAQDGKMFSDNLVAMSTSSDVVTAAYEKMTDTFAEKKDIIINGAKNLAVAAYDYIADPLKSAADTVIKWIDKLQKSMQKNGNKIIDTIKKLMEAAVALNAAFVTFNVIVKIATLITALSKSFVTASVAIKAYTAAIAASSAMAARGISVELLLASTLKAKELLIGAVTGKIGLATAAQTLWNAAMAANSIGIIAIAAAALVGTVVALTMAMSNQESAAQRELELAKKRHTAIRDNTQAYNELKEASFASASADLAKLDHVAELSRELTGLANATGTVQEKDKARAQFIVGELNAALGTEYTMTGNLIDQYSELHGSVQKLIEIKRAESLLAAQETVYQEALTKRTEAQKTVADSRIQMGQTEAEISALEAAHIQELTALQSTQALGAAASVEQHRAAGLILISGWYSELEARRATLAEQSAAYEGARITTQQYNADVAMYESASAALLAGNATQAIAAIESKNSAYLTHNDVVAQSSAQQQEILGQQYANQLMQLDEYLVSYNAGMDGYTLAGVQKQQEAATLCGAEAEKVGISIVDGQITGIDGKKIDLNNTMKSLVDGGLQIAKTKAPEFVPTGKNMAEGVADGIRNGKSSAVNAAVELVRAAINAANAEAKIKSPSKVTTKSGEFIGDGYVVGIENRIEDAKQAGVAIMRAATPKPDVTLASRITQHANAFAARMQSAVQQQQTAMTLNVSRGTERINAVAFGKAPATSAAPPPACLTFHQTNISPEPINGASASRNAEDMLNFHKTDWRIG